MFQRTPPWLGPTARLPRRGRRRAALAATRTCRRTASGTASGSSGRWATACSPACASTPTGSRRARRSSALNDIVRHDAHRVPRGASSPTGPTCSRRSCPTYPPGAKRMLRDNGVWARHAQARQRRSSSPTRSARSPPTGIVTADGVEHDVDVHHLRHRLPGVEVPHADEGHRPRRRRPARAVGRRRPRLPRHHRARASRTCSASTARTRTS